MSFKFFALLAACLMHCAVASANEERFAKVIAVLDGDTVLLKRDNPKTGRLFYKLRLADIDAPEKDQDYGEHAKKALAQLVLQQHVRVVTVATDSYGRDIGWIMLGRDARVENAVNTELVRRGWAWARSRSRSLYLRDAQQEAQRERRGLWATADAIPPWVWRKQKLLRESTE